jgi:hypothetical protein
MDIELHCKDCQKKFSFSEKSQALYSEQGWPDPIRCYDCRQAKKARHAKPQQQSEDNSQI